MDLIVWRHADAEDLSDGIAPPAITEIDFQADLARCLSSKGLRQAARMAQWLDRKLADNARILCSPAVRCEQTVVPLGRKYKICPKLKLELEHKVQLTQLDPFKCKMFLQLALH